MLLGKRTERRLAKTLGRSLSALRQLRDDKRRKHGALIQCVCASHLPFAGKLDTA